MGGPIGAVLGSADAKEPAEDQAAFTVGVIALGAKMAKADGVVTDDEVNAFKDGIQGTGWRDEERRPRFQSRQAGRRPDTRLMPNSLPPCSRATASCSRTCWKACSTSPRPTRCCIQTKDGFLAQVAKRFGITETEFSYIKARHAAPTKRNPYDVLGVKPRMGNDELKSHYRKLVVENHPDKLIARGVPKEFVAIATEKLAAINEAYAQIANEQVNLAEQFDAAWRRHTGAD